MICVHKDCEKGDHTFIVSHWLTNALGQKANSFTCQHCLLSVEGNNCVENLRRELHPGKDDKAAGLGTGSANTGNKEDKGANREGKKADRQA